MSLIDPDSIPALGIPQIDTQHRELVRRLNQLHAAVEEGRGHDAVAEALRFLRDYTQVHFQSEEMLMEAKGYPGYHRHRTVHAAFAARVREVANRPLRSGTGLTAEVQQFLAEWLVAHFEEDDAALATWMAAAKDRGPHHTA